MAAAVQHGRRKGMLRPGDGETPPAKAAILSPQDWRRIRTTLSGENKEKEARERRQQQRLDRHELSLNTVKNWENTIEGQRIKRLQAKKQREDQEEEERLKIDREEAEYQAKQRKEAIDRAKTLLYYQTDRIKGFHQSLLLSEVLREREKQIAFKNRRDELLKEKDREYLHYQEQERDRAIANDQLQAEVVARERNKLSAFQLMQIEEHEKAQKLEREAQLKDQATIEEDAQKYFEEEKAKEHKQLEKKMTLRKELDKVVADKMKLDQRQAEQEEAEAFESKIFADAKKKMMKMRKSKEAEIFQEFQTHQDRMTNLLAQQIKQKTSDEDEKIAKAVAEREAKREREEREKDQKFLKSCRDIHIHRLQMIKEMERKEREQKEMDQELLKQRIVQDQKFHAQQLEKQRQAAQEAKGVQEFYKSQMAHHRGKLDQEKTENRDYIEQNLSLLRVEEDQFREYSNQVIKEAKNRGAPTYALRAAARSGAGGGRGPVFSSIGGVRPSYQVTDGHMNELPSYASRNELPPALRRKDTSKRMGFTW